MRKKISIVRRRSRTVVRIGYRTVCVLIIVVVALLFPMLALSGCAQIGSYDRTQTLTVIASRSWDGTTSATATLSGPKPLMVEVSSDIRMTSETFSASVRSDSKEASGFWSNAISAILGAAAGWFGKGML